MSTSVVVPIVRKRTAQFKRFFSNRLVRVKQSWRKNRGIDCRVRRNFAGTAPQPSKGYRNDKRTRFMLRNGLYKVTVHNVDELNALLMHRESYCAEIGHAVSAKSRKDIVERSMELGIHVTNSSARLHIQEAD